MSESDAQTDSRSKIHKLPFIIKKDSIKKSSSNYGVLFRCLPGPSGNLIKEDVIYKTTEGDFLQGKYPALCIINRLDVAKNSSRTIAAHSTPNGAVIQLSSDAVVKLIGQANYDQVFTSLCCVINQELKVKGILSLLCASVSESKLCSVDTQTYESSFTHLIREKQRRNRCNRRIKVRSYIVQDPNIPKNITNKIVPGPKIQTVSKRVIIDPADFIKFEDIKVEDEEPYIPPLSDTDFKDIKVEANITEDSSIIADNKSISNVKQTDVANSDPFPDLKEIVDEDSNISDIGSVSNLSIGSSFSFANIEHNAKSILNCLDQCIQFDDHADNHCDTESPNLTIVMVDGSTVTLKGNPDPFHIASPDILKHLSPADQKKVMLHQAYLDWKLCLQRDEDDNLPIHTAVLNNDVGLLRRQCFVLKSRNESVDIVAAGNLTALQMSIFQDCPDCTAILLAHGADVMVRDDESRTTLHLAAEIGPKHVEALLKHCTNHAREILKDNEELWKPEFEDKPKEKLVNYLLTKLNTICDNQGNTPLMLASKIGNHIAVQLLVDSAPSTVNMAMPTSGNTALYLAVGAACTEAANRGDKVNIPDNFKKTIEILVERGADPSIDNNSGSNVNILLTEFQDITLSILIATKLAAFNGYKFNRCDSVMLLKGADGVISVAEMKKNPLNVYSHAKTIKDISEDKLIIDSKNDNENFVKHGKNYNNDTKIAAKGGKNIRNDQKIAATPGKNGNNDIKVVAVKPDSNVKNDQQPGDQNNTNKPVILKNLPVVTKIVTFGSDKPVLVRGIRPKVLCHNKGLQTQITAKCNTTKQHVRKSTGNNCTASKYLKIMAKPVKLLPTPESPKKTPNILRNAVKRRQSINQNDSASSSSKIPKT